jgi:hypothetical protein
MLHLLANQNFDNYNYIAISLAITVTILGLTFCLINSLREFDNVVMERQIDTTRVIEGLPTDFTLTPEDFRANLELVEIFGVTDNNLNIILESNEHFELVKNQFATIDYNNLMTLYEVIEAFISYFL